MQGNGTPIQVTIPIKPYLLKFIEHIEGLAPGEVFDLSRKSLVSDTLKRLFAYKKSYPLTSIRKGYDARLTVSIPQGMWAQGRFHLDLQAIYDFNTAMFYFFHELLEFNLMAAAEKGTERKVAIEEYMERLGIDEVVEFDTIKKGNFRLRKPRPRRIEPRKKASSFC